MNINTEHFFTYCSESVLLNFWYEFGWAKFTVRLYENEEIIYIKAQTKHIYSDFSGHSDRNVTVFAPFMENLGDFLETKNGVYVPSNDFVQMMDETRRHYNLAYGLRTSRYQKIIRFDGAFTIAFVPESELIITLKNQD